MKIVDFFKIIAILNKNIGNLQNVFNLLQG